MLYYRFYLVAGGEGVGWGGEENRERTGAGQTSFPKWKTEIGKN